MRIIHTSDWHIGKNLSDYSLLEDQQFFFDNFYKELIELKPDVLIVAGDIYDRSIPSSEAVSLLNSVLNKIVLELSIPTIIIAGNHDSKERLSFATDLLKNNKLFIEGKIKNDIPRITIKGSIPVNFYPLPFFEQHNVKSLYKDSAIISFEDGLKLHCDKMLQSIDATQVNILICHDYFMYSINTLQLIDDLVGGREPINAMFFDKFDYVALGHIHSSKSIGSPKMRYSGSPIKYSIDEAQHTKSFTIIDIKTKSDIDIWTKEIHPLRDVRTIRGSFEDICNPDNHMNVDDYIFVVLTDTDYILNAMNRLKGIFPHIMGLEYENLNYENKLDFPTSMSDNADELTLFSNFFKQVTSDELNENQLKLVKDIFDEVKKANEL